MFTRSQSSKSMIYEAPNRPVKHVYEELDYQVPVKHVYEEPDYQVPVKHVYEEPDYQVPHMQAHIYAEVGFPVAEYSVVEPTKVAKKTRRTSQQKKIDDEEKQNKKKQAEEIKYWNDKRKKSEKEEIARAKRVADEEREKKRELEAEQKKMAEALKKSLTQQIKSKEETQRKRKEAREQKKAELAAKKATELYEVSEEARKRMFLTGKTFGGKGFRAKEFTAKYTELYGKTNPYTGEPAEASYDLTAAIRGLMYECSPSSNQSWFRHGVGKKAEQVAPWLFYNKALAEFNDANGWKQWTETTSKGRERGTWFVLTEGSNARYDWQNEKYGPKPSGKQLAAAAIGRTLGWRK
jgi:hypothetical protein